MANSVHVPILLRPIVDALIEALSKLPNDQVSHWIVDCTFGGGGHTGEILRTLSEKSELRRHRVLALDQDAGAVARGRDRFADAIREGRLELTHLPFSRAGEVLAGRSVMGLMADLGFSSDQLEAADRGLSFHREGPLDMRLDPSRGKSCVEYLASASEAELERVLREYGEERFSKRIAAAIVQARQMKELPRTTSELSRLVVRAIPSFARHGKIHAATRSFQALRIAVNRELEELDALLEQVVPMVRPGGRVAILSFHSLEDRRVKTAFKRGNANFLALTKKPIEADEEEVRGNPRARSAKLRIAERLAPNN